MSFSIVERKDCNGSTFHVKWLQNGKFVIKLPTSSWEDASSMKIPLLWPAYMPPVLLSSKVLKKSFKTLMYQLVPYLRKFFYSHRRVFNPYSSYKVQHIVICTRYQLFILVCWMFTQEEANEFIESHREHSTGCLKANGEWINSKLARNIQERISSIGRTQTPDINNISWQSVTIIIEIILCFL